PDNVNADFDERETQQAALLLGRKCVIVRARGPLEFEMAFAQAIEHQAGAVLLASDPMLLSQRNVLLELAARRSLPVMYWAREFVLAGGLICYGTSITWMYHQAGIYCGRILKGAKPAELPVMQPAKFDLFINLKTAKALGLTVPASLLNRADEVI